MSRQLNISICEDNAADARLLSDIVRNSGLLCDIAMYESAERLLSESNLNGTDLFLLDIYLGGMSGVELARELRARNCDCEIVFITSSDAHALEAFEADALQYLAKPLDPKKVAAMLERFITIRDRRDLNYCTVIADKTEVKIFHRDIHYIEIFDKRCVIHTANGMTDTHSTLGKLLEKLPNPPFLRCHRGYVVNMDHVRGVEHDFLMEDGGTVYISKSERKKIKQTYMQYLAAKARGRVV